MGDRLQTHLAALRRAFARRSDPYAGADIGSSRSMLAALCGLTGVLGLVLLLLRHPTDPFGPAGWLPAVAVIAAFLVGARVVADQDRHLDYDQLLAIAYAGLAGIAVLQWLTGDVGSPVALLFLAWVATGAAVPPPRRSLAHLLTTLVLLALPLVYEGYSANGGTDTAALALLAVAIWVLLSRYLLYIRRQRVGLKSGEQQARELALIDPLTGLHNRRAFEEALGREAARAQRSGSSLSLALVDLHRLKRINDGHGHMEGDRCLRELAQALATTVRMADHCFRWGGDEFAVLLPGAGRADAERMLGRLRVKVEEATRDPDGRPLRVSAGAAQLDESGDPQRAIAQADSALRREKESEPA